MILKCGGEGVDIPLQAMLWSLKNLRHTVMQPKQVVQRESNNESKARKSIPTLNFIIHKKSYSL